MASNRNRNSQLSDPSLNSCASLKRRHEELHEDDLVKRTEKLSEKTPPKLDDILDVDDYIVDAQFYIDDMDDECPHKLVRWLLLGIRGDPRTLIRSFIKEIKTPKQLFKVLERECRPRGSFSNIVQAENEPIRTFSARIRRHLDSMDPQLYDKNPELYKELYIKQLTEGAIYEINQAFDRLYPDTIDQAFTYAVKIEEDLERNKWLARNEHMEALKEIKDSAEQINENKTTESVSIAKNKMVCFICGGSGHGYVRCFKGTAEMKFKIRAKLLRDKKVVGEED